MVIPELSALRSLGQEDYCEFKASKSYNVGPCQNKERKKEEEKETSLSNDLGKQIWIDG